MRERLVGLRHLVHVVALLDDVALALERVDDLGCDCGGHAHAVARAGKLRRPAEGERELAVRGDRHRNRVGRAANTAGLDLDLRLHVVNRGGNDLERILELLLVLDELGGILLHLLGDLLDCAVDNLLGDGLLAVLHDDADHVRDELGIELRVEDDALDDSLTSAAHVLLLLFLLALHAVLRTAAVATCDAEGVELAADDVVADARKVLHTASADEHNAVLLEVVAFAGDVGRDFNAGREAHTGDLAEGGVRLLGGHRLDDETDAAALGAGLERRRFRMRREGMTPLADQLVDCRHLSVFLVLFQSGG